MTSLLNYTRKSCAFSTPTFFQKWQCPHFFFSVQKICPTYFPMREVDGAHHFLFLNLTNHSTLFSALSNHTCQRITLIRERTRNNTQSSRFVTRVQHMNSLSCDWRKASKAFQLGGYESFFNDPCLNQSNNCLLIGNKSMDVGRISADRRTSLLSRLQYPDQ